MKFHAYISNQWTFIQYSWCVIGYMQRWMLHDHGEYGPVNGAHAFWDYLAISILRKRSLVRVPPWPLHQCKKSLTKMHYAHQEIKEVQILICVMHFWNLFLHWWNFCILQGGGLDQGHSCLEGNLIGWNVGAPGVKKERNYEFCFTLLLFLFYFPY